MRVHRQSGLLKYFPPAAWGELSPAAQADWDDYMIPVPGSVSRRQFLLWLNTRNITRGQIRALLAGKPSAGREALSIEFDEARDFDRSHPLIKQLAADFGLSSSDLDEGFRTASFL